MEKKSEERKIEERCEGKEFSDKNRPRNRFFIQFNGIFSWSLSLKLPCSRINIGIRTIHGILNHG